MKRVLTQKVKLIPACAVDSVTAGSLKPVPALANRRVRKGAAMIGLAISMGASSLLLPQQGDSAMATEPTDGGQVPTVPASATVSVGETEAQPGVVAAEMTMPKQSAIPHKAFEGQTIGSNTQTNPMPTAVSYPMAQRIATNLQGASSTGAADLRIPGLMEKSQEFAPSVVPTNGYSSSRIVVNEASLPSVTQESLGTSDAKATIASPVNQLLKAKQAVAINRLRDSSNRLRSSLAEWKSEESANLSAQNSEADKSYVPSYVNPVAESNVESAVVNQPAIASEPVTATTQPQTYQAAELPQVVVPEPQAAASVTTYKVQPGDTLSGIAQHYGIAAKAIATANQLDNPNRLQIAQMLTIPKSSLGASAAKFQSNLRETAYIRPGQQLPASEPIITNIAVPTKQRTSSTLTVSVVPGLVIDPEYDRNLGPYVPLTDEAVPEAAVASASLGTDVVEPFKGKVASGSQSGAGIKQVAVGEPSDAKSSELVLDADSADSRGAAKHKQNNPYIERLRAELSQLRDQYTRTGHFSDRQHAAATPSAATPAAPVSPEFEARRSNQAQAENGTTAKTPANLQQAQTRTADAANSRTQAPTIATAPLGSDPYQPFQVTPGQMVSPDLPPLGDPNQYLPGGSNQNFNGFIWPTRGTLTSGYGRRWGRMHRGIDVAAPTGTPIYAAAPGVVVYARWNSGGYGNLVDIRHADGTLTRYGHNSRIFVQEGQVVEQGQHISAMGSTGFSTGPHLHFEVHPAGRGAVNPIAFLPSRSRR